MTIPMRTEPAAVAALDEVLACRRRHDRYPVSGKVLVFHPEGPEPFTGWFANISASGAFIQTEEMLPKGTRVRLVFGAGGGWDLEATVVRAAKPSLASTALGIAVEFDRVIPVPQLDPTREPFEYAATLKATGLTRQAANRLQLVASVADENFETHVGDDQGGRPVKPTDE